MSPSNKLKTDKPVQSLLIDRILAIEFKRQFGITDCILQVGIDEYNPACMKSVLNRDMNLEKPWIGKCNKSTTGICPWLLVGKYYVAK